MSKLLKRLNDNQNKVADTNGIMKLQAWDYGVAQDLTNKQITATVANASGFLFDLDLVSNGTEIDLDFKDSQLQKLTPDTYFIEIKVTDEAGDVSVFPTEGYATFTINKNLHATEGALVPQITFDTVLADVKKAVDEKVADYTSTIAKGDKGATGPQGSTGKTGPQGPKGDKGDTGPKGDKGDTGATGPRGTKGAKGSRGKRGYRGHTGPQGPQGIQGKQGIQGPKGDKGDTGATGPRGTKGAKGSRGKRGYRGHTGPQGIPATYQTNLLVNSDFYYDLQGWNTQENSSGAEPAYPSYINKDVKARVVGFNTTGYTDRKYSRFNQFVNLANNPTGSSKITVQWQAYANIFTTYAHLFMSFYTGFDGTGDKVALVDAGNSKSSVGDTSAMWGWVNKDTQAWEVQHGTVTIPDKAKSVKVDFETVEGNNLYLAKPMLAFGDSISTYTSGGYYPKDDIQALKDHAVIDTGNQTIAGNKTFSGNTTIGGTLMTDSGWKNMSLASGVKATVARYRLLNGVVYIQVLDVIVDVGKVFTTLPAGYRPPHRIWESWFAAGKSGNFMVDDKGQVSRASSTTSGTDSGTKASFEVSYPID